jgi:hypothetical protein
VAVPTDVAGLEDALAAAAKARYRAAVAGLRVIAASRLLASGDSRGAQAMMDACDRAASEPCWAAELLRLDAELLLRNRDKPGSQAENLLRESLRLAREQKAGLWERRTAELLASAFGAS